MKDLAWSSNICLSGDGQIQKGQSVGEDSDSRRVPTQQLSNKRSVLSNHWHCQSISLCPSKQLSMHTAQVLDFQISFKYLLSL